MNGAARVKKEEKDGETTGNKERHGGAPEPDDELQRAE
jgi:hypothetical protein